MTTDKSYQDYETPMDLLGDTKLTQAEKIELFERWLEDEEALVRASTEGLEGGKENHLSDVQNILSDLKADKA